ASSGAGSGRKPLWIAGGVIGALLLAAVIVLGVRLLGGSAIQTAEGDVDNAEEFLATVTQDWTSSLPQEHITRPPGTLVDASGDEAPDGIADLEAPPLPHAE